MDRKKILIGLGLVAAIVIAYVLYKRKQEEEAEAPPAQAPNGSLSAAGQIYDVDESPAMEAIEARIEQLYRNDRKREDIYEDYGVRDSLFAGLSYPGGVRQVLAAALPSGNPNEVPVIPREISRTYQDRLAFVADLQPFEEIEDNGIEVARRQWQNALDFYQEAGFTLWPQQADDLVLQGAFFVSGPADSNRSEAFDSFTEDMRLLTQNILRANEKAQEALREAAIQDLRRAGWKFLGMDGVQNAVAL